MENREVVEMLNGLIKLDVDAIHAYGHAIREMDLSVLQESLIHFRQDHERHVHELSRLVRELGGSPTAPTQDFKGYLIEGFTAIRSKMGMAGALRAMRLNEQLTNRRYGQARGQALPEPVKAVVDRNAEDERRHLEYIETAIREHT